MKSDSATRSSLSASRWEFQYHRPARRKNIRRRGLLEALVLAFAVGFGAAQYLAYRLYHEQNRLILAEAVPVPVVHTANAAAPTPVSNQHIARSTPAETVFHARYPATPVAIAHAVAPKMPKLNAVAPGCQSVPSRRKWRSSAPSRPRSWRYRHSTPSDRR